MTSEIEETIEVELDRFWKNIEINPDHYYTTTELRRLWMLINGTYSSGIGIKRAKTTRTPKLNETIFVHWLFYRKKCQDKREPILGLREFTAKGMWLNVTI